MKRQELGKQVTAMSWQKMFAPWILNRGRNYWDDGCVERLCQDGGTVTAVVSGTEDYDVEIEMGRGGSILSNKWGAVQNADCRDFGKIHGSP